MRGLLSGGDISTLLNKLGGKTPRAVLQIAEEKHVQKHEKNAAITSFKLRPHLSKIFSVSFRSHAQPVYLTLQARENETKRRRFCSSGDVALYFTNSP